MTDHNEAIRPNMNDRSEREFMGRMESNHAKLTEFSQVVGSFTQDYQRLYSTYTSYRDMLREVIAERDTLRAEVERLREAKEVCEQVETESHTKIFLGATDEYLDGRAMGANVCAGLIEQLRACGSAATPG